MRLISTILGIAVGLSVVTAEPLAETSFNDLDNIACHPLDPAGKLASVMIFYWQDCPVSNGYAPELNRLRASYTNFAFYIVQIDPELSVSAARQHARQYDLQLPVLLDPKHELVRLTQATVTPEAVVWGTNGAVWYRGRIDDVQATLGKRRAAATEHDLRNALDDIAAGRPVRKKETKAVGCSIQ